VSAEIAAMVVELDKEILTSEITSTLLPLIMTRDEENIVRVRAFLLPSRYSTPLGIRWK
jgi:Trp operon repressor